MCCVGCFFILLTLSPSISENSILQFLCSVTQPVIHFFHLTFPPPQHYVWHVSWRPPQRSPYESEAASRNGRCPPEPSAWFIVSGRSSIRSLMIWRSFLTTFAFHERKTHINKIKMILRHIRYPRPISRRYVTAVSRILIVKSTTMRAVARTSSTALKTKSSSSKITYHSIRWTPPGRYEVSQ